MVEHLDGLHESLDSSPSTVVGGGGSVYHCVQYGFLRQVLTIVALASLELTV